MMARRSTKRRPRVVGVIASRADLERAVRMRRPPDLFELRLDRLAGMADEVEKVLPKLRTPLIITARDPREGGANKLRLRQRRDLLARFLNHADYIDVELRSARALRALLAIAKTKNVRRIISFHDFKSTPSARILAAKAREAKSHGADIFKVATRTDTPMELGRLLEFITSNRLNVRTCRHGHRQTWGDFTCPAGARRLGADLRIGRCRDRRRRPTVAGTTPRIGLRSVKLVNRFSLFTLDTCPLLDAHKVQMTVHHVLIRDFTRAITRDAASGSGAVSTCAAAALHFRAAVSQDAGARASKASDVLRDVD